MHHLSRIAIALLFACPLGAAEFQSTFDKTNDRVWLGEQYWANPMEDWRVKGGRLECIRGGENRNVHLLTHWLKGGPGAFTMSVRVGQLRKGNGNGSAGFLIGVRDPVTGDRRSSLFFGEGYPAGITADGRLFLGSPPKPGARSIVEKIDDIILTVTAKPTANGCRLILSASRPNADKGLGAISQQNVPFEALRGNIALVNNYGGNRRPHVNGDGPRPCFWFRDWKVSGGKVATDQKATFGPILYAMHTLSRGVLKMTAQMPPVGDKDPQSVSLHTKTGDTWKKLADAKIDPLSRTATFRIEKWDDTKDTPYRLTYSDSEFTGTVRKDPKDKADLVIAGFTGNTDSGFPNNLVANNVAAMNPDVLFFSGDQIYEGVGGYGIFRNPVPLATLNYLRKIYMWGWAFRELMRDRPTLVLPDDHDVYQGNIWGQGGRDCKGIRNHAQGGYAMPAEWVNMIQRTQTSHHPDAFDPTPIDQKITVYYGDMVYGRVSFAVLEDRKFKSGPENKVNTWKGRPDHIKDAKYNTSKVDKPGLKLLGDRQLKFLRAWTSDWKGADMKLAVSQTIFCNLANYHGAAQEFIIADLDSNGWPQTARNKALEELRRGFAFHYAGDQHLPSIVHHGIDAPADAGFSFCVPSIAAGYPRSWRPDAEGRPVKNRPKEGLPNTGDYIDGLGNHVRVYAIGNPAKKNRRGRINTLHDKASGFGIVRMNKAKRTISIECYRLQIDPKNLKPMDQFPGWPKTITVADNYGKKPAGHLPTVKVKGMTNPVVSVIDEATKVPVYTLRVGGTTFRPKVFDTKAKYTVEVGDPDTGRWKTFEGVTTTDERGASLDVDFPK